MPRSPAARLPAGLLISTLGEARGLQPGAQLGCRMVVGRGVLDAGEAGARRGLEAIEKRHFAEQEPEICAETRHGAAPFQG